MANSARGGLAGGHTVESVAGMNPKYDAEIKLIRSQN